MTLFSILALVKTPIWSCPTADGMRYRLLGRVALAWFFCSTPLAVRQSSTHSKGPWSGQSPYIHCLWHSSQTKSKENDKSHEWQGKRWYTRKKFIVLLQATLRHHNAIVSHVPHWEVLPYMDYILVHHVQPPKVFEWFWSEKGFFLSGFPLGILFTKNYFFHINIGAL